MMTMAWPTWPTIWFPRLVVGAVFLAAPVSGQAPAVGVGVAEALARFEEANTDWASPDRAAREGALLNMVYRAGKLPVAKADSVLDGLERLALGSAVATVRHSATSTLGLAGYKQLPDRVEGIVSRLEGLYQASEDGVVRTIIVAGMDRQGETGAAIDFLKRAAQDSRPGDSEIESPARWAVETLARLDTEEARAVLHDLHTAGAAKHPAARRYLRYIASRGYRN
jgi:hypothetical protein